MKSWSLVVVLALFALSSALPVPEDDSSVSTASDEKTSVFPEEVDDDDLETKNNAPRSIPDNDAIIAEMNPSERITQALENVSKTLRMGIKNLGNSAIQILEGTGVATEQALGTGARIVTGVAETAAEAAETGAKSAIRIANGVANSLSQSTKVLVDTKTQLLKGLTGSSALQADASSNTESVQRNERANTGGYSSGGYPSTSYGPNTVAETPNNFLNVFSQAAANTVNFGTQLLNSLVGVAANILQGTVSTLLSLLNAKGQVVGAVVQSAPPVLASVTRTAGDVLAAKARIFGAVTQGLARLFIEVMSEALNTLALVKSRAKDSKARVLTASGKALRISVGATTRGIESVYEAAVSFGSQLARVFGDLFSGVLNRQGGEAGGSGGSPIAQIAQLFSGLTARGSGSSSGLSGSGSSSANLLSGVGNFAQTAISSKLNLLNGILAPFTGGRPLLNFGNRGSSSSSSSSSSSGSGYSEPNFRISIASASTPKSISVSSPSDSSSTKSNGPRSARFYLSPEATPKTDGQLTSSNLIATFKSGVFKGIVDQFNSDLQTRIKKLTSPPARAAREPFLSSYDNSGSFRQSSFAPLINTKANAGLNSNSKEASAGLDFSKLLPLAFANANLNNDYFNFNN